MRFGLITAVGLAVTALVGWFAAPASAMPAAPALAQTGGIVEAASAKGVENAYHRRRHFRRKLYRHFRRYHRPYYRKRHSYRYYRRHHRPYHRKRHYRRHYYYRY